MQLAPAHHLRAELRDAPIEGVDGLLLLGHLLLEGPRLDRQLAELNPVSEEREERRDCDGDAGHRREGRGARDVEADDAGAVAPHDEKAELLAAAPASVGPWGSRPRPDERFRLRLRLRQNVNGRFQGTHGESSRASRVPEPGHEQSTTSETPPAITAISTDSSRQFGNVSLTRNLA
jgi:hypothetical protein